MKKRMNTGSLAALVSFMILAAACPADVWGQLADARWIFGNNAGMNFTAAEPAPFLVPADGFGFNAYEGCASISNEEGELLFFTNGQRVWNREFNTMPNGNSIIPTDALVGSTTQATAIVAVPGSDTRFYIFSLEEQAMPGRLYYSLVDMSLNGGLGDVVAGEKGILLDDGLTEKMTVAPGKCMQAWVIVRAKASNEYKAFAITEAGLNTEPVISETGNGPLNSYITGTIKCSNDGKKIAAALFPRPPEYIAAIELYDFDGATGELSEAATLLEKEPGPEEAGYYSICFSPDNTKLYAGSHFPNTVSQFDISLPSLEAMRASEALVQNMGTVIPGDMRTGPDGKLYIAAFEKNYLNRIDFPNIAGIDCGFVNNAISLPEGAYCLLGLPNNNVAPSSAMVYDTTTSYTHKMACSEARLSSPAAEGPYLWNTGETTREITVTEPGHYNVISQTTCSRRIDSFEVAFTELPSSLLGSDTAICAGSVLPLAVLPWIPDHFSFSWNTGANGRAIQVSLPGSYSVTASLLPCVITDTITVTHKDCECHIEIPSAFSPNGDGINDLFMPLGTPGCTAIAGYSLNIYNRWGQRIFSSNAMEKGWNGLHLDIPVDIGVYFFTLSYIDRYNTLQVRKGDITVVR